MRLTKLRLINLLVIMDPNLFKLCLKQVDSISITCVKPIFSELFHFSVSHLFCFFNLLRIELNLSWVDGSSGSSINISIRFEIIWIHITIVIWISLLLLSLLRFTSSCSSILLSNSTFQLVHSNFFKFLSHQGMEQWPWEISQNPGEGYCCFSSKKNPFCLLYYASLL